MRDGIQVYLQCLAFNLIFLSMTNITNIFGMSKTLENIDIDDSCNCITITYLFELQVVKFLL